MSAARTRKPYRHFLESHVPYYEMQRRARNVRREAAVAQLTAYAQALHEHYELSREDVAALLRLEASNWARHTKDREAAILKAIR